MVVRYDCSGEQSLLLRPDTWVTFLIDNGVEEFLRVDVHSFWEMIELASNGIVMLGISVFRYLVE